MEVSSQDPWKKRFIIQECCREEISFLWFHLIYLRIYYWCTRSLQLARFSMFTEKLWHTWLPRFDQWLPKFPTFCKLRDDCFLLGIQFHAHQSQREYNSFGCNFKIWVMSQKQISSPIKTLVSSAPHLTRKAFHDRLHFSETSWDPGSPFLQQIVITKNSR